MGSTFIINITKGFLGIRLKLQFLQSNFKSAYTDRCFEREDYPKSLFIKSKLYLELEYFIHVSILINSETIYLFKDFNDANEEISVNWRLQPIDFSVLSIKKFYAYMLQCDKQLEVMDFRREV